jgi:DNA-binding protein Fis
VEQLLVDEALRRATGNQSIAATMLGITRQALNKRLKKAAPSDD